MQKYLITTQSYRYEYAEDLEIPTEYGYLVETDFAGFTRWLSIPTPTDSPYDERLKSGLRGISIRDRKLYIASWNTVHIVDYDTFVAVDAFSHPLMSDLHGIHVDDDGIWVTSSLIDSILHFDWKRNLQNVLTISNTTLYPSQHRAEVDLTQDYRLRGKVKAGFTSFHANHITSYDDAHVLVTGRGPGPKDGRVLKMDRKTLEYKLWIKGLHGPHDGLFLSSELFAVTETNGSTVAICKLRRWRRPKVVRRIQMPSSENKYWTRGLAVAPDGHLYVGRSVWKGDNRLALVVEFTPDGKVITEHELNLPDYPECRIFQITPSPQG